jgi:hypothetical protein
MFVIHAARHRCCSTEEISQMTDIDKFLSKLKKIFDIEHMLMSVTQPVSCNLASSLACRRTNVPKINSDILRRAKELSFSDR